MCSGPMCIITGTIIVLVLKKCPGRVVAVACVPLCDYLLLCLRLLCVCAALCVPAPLCVCVCAAPTHRSQRRRIPELSSLPEPPISQGSKWNASRTRRSTVTKRSFRFTEARLKSFTWAVKSNLINLNAYRSDLLVVIWICTSQKSKKPQS